MDREKSSTAREKGTVDRRQRAQKWLRENNAGSLSTITQLRRVVNSVNTFADGELCLQFLQEQRGEKVVYAHVWFV